MGTPGLFSYVDRMERWGDRTFLVGSKGYRKRPWSYREVRSAILALSREIEGLHIETGDRVILQGPSSPEWVVAFFAVIHRGGVVVPVDAQPGGASPSSGAPGSDEFFRRIVKKVSPALMIGERAPKRWSRPFIPFAHIEALKETCGGSRTGWEKPGMRADTADEPPPGGGTLAELVFTSGTTSEPKGVMLTHENILANLGPISDGIDRRRGIVRLLPPIRILCTVPFSHMFGQAAGIFLPILLGSTVYFTPETGPAALIRAIKRDRVFTLIAVPRVLKLLADHVKAELAARRRTASFERRWERLIGLPYPIRALFFMDVHLVCGIRFWSFIVGGAALDHETHEFWRRLVFSVFQGYGLTEAAPMVTMFNPFRHDRRSVGKLFPGQEVRIGPDGEILVRGRNIMNGYYGDPASTKKALQDGWLRTGDIGTIDEKGHLFIRGRVKEMISTSDGHNVFAEDVEGALRRIKGVRDAAVIGRGDGIDPASTDGASVGATPGAGTHGSGSTGGESVHAVLILEDGAKAEAIVSEANKTLLPYQRIRSFTVWRGKDFPRTATQKVKKLEVIKSLKTDKTRHPRPEEILDGLVPGRPAPGARLLEDLGLDSLDLVEVVARAEKKFGMTIDETLIGPGTTVADLEKLAVGGTEPATRLSMPRWAAWPFVGFIRRVLVDIFILPAFRVVFEVRGRGLGRVGRMTPPSIIAANHTSALDPLFVLLTLPVRMRRLLAPAMGLNRFNARFSRFSPLEKKARPGALKLLQAIGYGVVTFLFQTFPFPQGIAYRPSLEYTGELLDRGRWILIFPEGEVARAGKPRSRDNPDRSGRSFKEGAAASRTGRFRGGVARIAENTGAPVVPAAIGREGRRVTVSYGAPLCYAGEGYDAFAQKVQSAVKGMRGLRSVSP